MANDDALPASASPDDWSQWTGQTPASIEEVVARAFKAIEWVPWNATQGAKALNIRQFRFRIDLIGLLTIAFFAVLLLRH